MKRFLFFALVAMMFASCVTDETWNVAVDFVPETLTVSFEDIDSRIQLQGRKTVWTSGDLVSVFYRSNANQKWSFQGKTGERTAQLRRVEMGAATEAMSDVIVIYPYSEKYQINTNTYEVGAYLPAMQSYLADSYGIDGNIMVSQSEYNQFALKSVCGWLKLQLTGNGEKIRTISIKGNNGEQVAGQIYVNTSDATCVLASEREGQIADDAILTTVTLNCGGVDIGAEPTNFHIALPPQIFAKGFTVEIVSLDGRGMTKSTDKVVSINRNEILPMEPFELSLGDALVKPADNEIWYTSTDGKIVEPYRGDENGNADDITLFGANIVSNTYANGLGVIEFDSDPVFIGKYAFNKCNTLKSISLPSKIKSIGVRAFDYCSYMQYIHFPNSLSRIEDYACFRCHGLQKITIPDSVTYVGESAFSYAAIPDGLYGKYASDDHKCIIYDDGNSKKLIVLNKVSGDYTLPDGITVLPQLSMTRFSNGSTITIPESVVELTGCPVTTSQGLAAFYGKFASADGRCLIYENELKGVAPYGLSDLVIPEGVTTMNNQLVFQSITSLKSITLPTTAEKFAYIRCKNLEAFYVKAVTPPTIGTSSGTIFTDSTPTVYVPAESVNAYKNASGWKTVAKYIVGYDFEKGEVVPDVTQSASEIYYTSSDGKAVELYSTSGLDATVVSNVYENGQGVIRFDGVLTKIGSRAFYGCTTLTSVNVPYGVKTIGGNAFYGCKSLTSVTLPDSITSLGTYAFYKCTSLTGITLPDSVKSLGTYVFSHCESLVNITLPDSVTSIGSSAFSYCVSLTSVTLPNSLKTINSTVFHTCKSLTNITIPDSVTSIGGSAFKGCSALVDVVLGKSMATISSYAFYDCSSLVSITIPSSVTTMGKGVFRDCTALNEVYCTPTVPPTGGDLFAQEDGAYTPLDCKIYVPAASVNQYKTATYWSDYSEYIVGYDFEKGEVVTAN